MRTALDTLTAAISFVTLIAICWLLLVIVRVFA